MKANQNAMNAYVKSISKRNDGEEKEKILPIGCMGSAMANHGEDFEPDSEFGQCLVAMGRSNERIGRIQEGYISRASSSWLDSSERSVAQMKEYQVGSTDFADLVVVDLTWCRLLERSWTAAALLTTLLLQKWRKQNARTFDQRRN